MYGFLCDRGNDFSKFFIAMEKLYILYLKDIRSCIDQAKLIDSIIETWVHL